MPSHRVTGDLCDVSQGAGWEEAHVDIDDHSRAGFVQMHADEQMISTVDFLKAAVAHYAALGVRLQPVLISTPLPAPAKRSASTTASPDLTARKPMAKPSALSRPA